MAVTVAHSAFADQAFSGAATLTFASYAHPGGPLAVLVASRTDGVTGVTANGTAMDARGSESGNNNAIMTGWTLNSIASFTANIVISFVGAPAEVYLAVAHALSFSGASATPFGTAVTAFGSSTTPSVTVSSASGRLVVAALVSLDTDTTHTIGSGQTLVRDDPGTGGGDATLRHRIVTTTEGGAGSVVMDGTLANSESWTALGFDVTESGGGGGGSWGMLLGGHNNRLVRG
jgi:hypothetical protein